MNHRIHFLLHLALAALLATAALLISTAAPATEPAAAQVPAPAPTTRTTTLATASATTATSAAQTTAATATPTKRVCVIPVQGEFENALYLILVRAMRQAERQGADAIVLDMNTPGGRVDAAMKIRDLLIGSDIPTYTYVNPMAISAGSFIAVATDKIVMGPNGSIGGALPIELRPDGAQGADKKFISVFAAEMRKTAKTKHHPEQIAEAFCNPDLVIPGLKERGDILTLDYDQATSYGLAAYQASSLEAMLAREGLGDAHIERFSLTLTDRLARFLSSSAVMALLLTIGIGGIFMELKAPGISLPGVVGGTAIVLYFLGSYLANLSGYMEWILFAIGVVLLVVEVYVLPGFGIAGIAGIALIVGSLFFGLVNLAPDGGLSLGGVRLQMLKGPALTVIAGLLGVIPALLLLAKLFPVLPGYGELMLAPGATGMAAGNGPAANANGDQPRAGNTPSLYADLHVGDRGQAISALRPSGTAEFSGRRVDVVTQGDWLESGAPLTILRIEGAVVTVAEDQPA